jgi:hypothetical protein
MRIIKGGREVEEYEEVEIPWLVSFPQTPEQIEVLKKIHGPFFGICSKCQAAGHVDQLYEDEAGELWEICDDCLRKMKEKE